MISGVCSSSSIKLYALLWRHLTAHRAGIQFVRCKGHGPYKPLTTKKLFFVPQHPEVEKIDGVAERKQKYSLLMRSIREHLTTDQEMKEQAEASQLLIDVGDSNFEEALAKTKQFNLESATYRERRENVEKKVSEAEQLELLSELEEQKRLQQEAARKHVLETLKESGRFISSANLQSAIEEALNQRATYDFAIDLDGQRYKEQPDGSVVIQTRQDVDAQKTEQL